jgi:hypothetical protein
MLAWADEKPADPCVRIAGFIGSHLPAAVSGRVVSFGTETRMP